VKTLQDLRLSLRKRGGAPAAVNVGEGRAVTLSYAELFEASGRLMEDIASCGVVPGSAVGLMAPNGPAWIEAFWAIVAAGGVVMPIDVSNIYEDIRRMLAMGDCQLVLAGRAQIGRLQSLGFACAMVDIDAPRPIPDAPSRVMHEPPQPNDTALLAFTSGTTGTPKAVKLSHANLMSNVEALVEARIISRQDRALVPLPLHHAYPLTVGMLTVLASGATMVFPAGLSGPQMIQAVREGQVTVLLGVPRIYNALLTNIRAELVGRSGPEARLFPLLLAASSRIHRFFGVPAGRWLFRPLHKRVGLTLRLMVSGGAALSGETEPALLGLGWRVLTGYGLTETSPILTFNRPGRSRIGSSGQALPGVRVRIANADQDGIGEIEVSGISVFSGYHQDQAATANAFTGDGWFRTGDLGRLDEAGYLFVMARAKETIVLPSGKKIDPESIEKSYAADPVIGEIAILRREDGLAALVVPNDQAVREAGAFRIRSRIRDALNVRGRVLPPHLRLAGFAITRQSLPRTQLGKLRRHLLPALYEHALEHSEVAREVTAVSTADEELLSKPVVAAVWDWMRTRYPGQVIDLETSPQLDLGIDSLGWLDLTLELQRELGIAITEQQIAGIVTMRDLLREAAVAVPSEASSLVGPEAQLRWLAPARPAAKSLRIVGEALLRIIMRVLFRLRVEGVENLPASPFMICPNHVSYLDAFALAAALPHRKLKETYWAGWTGLLFSSRLRRFFSEAAQVVPIDPDHAVAAGISTAMAILSQEKTLVWFPEGGLSPNGSLQPFLPGVGVVLERYPVPVVPAYILGTRAALPPGKKIPKLHDIVIRFGPAINPAVVAPEGSRRDGHQLIASTLRMAVANLKQN
jgi:long-chain acyl-CoA synthetase